CVWTTGTSPAEWPPRAGGLLEEGMRIGIGGIWLLTGLLALVGSTRAAHAQATSAAVQGVVKDNQGAVVPGVAVTVTNTETGLAREVSSSDVGFYHVTALPPGTYAIAAKLDGFCAFDRSGLALTLGPTATVDIPPALPPP